MGQGGGQASRAAGRRSARAGPCGAGPCGAGSSFAEAHEIHIVAFNSLKLRLDHPDLEGQWHDAVLEFARYDVVLLSEVRASDKLWRKRALLLLEMLAHASESQWQLQPSEPSGPGAPEVHVLLVKQPVRIVDFQTVSRIGAVQMDHAPLVATLEDPRFVGELRRVNVASVHFPPRSAGRRAARDAQIAAFLGYYAAEAAARLGQPLSNQAAKETKKKAPYVAHVIGGDFNADANELRELGAEKHGFEVQLGCVRTSSGGKAYDNFLVARDGKDHLTLGSRVLDLRQYANFSRGQQGLSDHAPIALRLQEVPREPQSPAERAASCPRRRAAAKAEMATLGADPAQSVVTKEVTWEYPDDSVRTLPAGTYTVGEFERLWNRENEAWRAAMGAGTPARDAAPAPARPGPRAEGGAKTVFQMGSRVSVRGLEAHARLNGRDGTIRSFDSEKQRFAVLVDDDKAPVLIRPKNLKPALTEQMSRVTIERPDDAGTEAVAALNEAQRMHESMVEARSRGDEKAAAGFALGALSASERAERLLGKTPLKPRAGVVKPPTVQTPS